MGHNFGKGCYLFLCLVVFNYDYYVVFFNFGQDE